MHTQLEEQLHHHKLDVLDEAASRQLLRQSAGLQGHLEDALQEVEAAILEACGGLPLALRLTGGQLYKSKDQAFWKVMLIALMYGYTGTSYHTCIFCQDYVHVTDVCPRCAALSAFIAILSDVHAPFC
jgi:hypothetical protein